MASRYLSGLVASSLLALAPSHAADTLEHFQHTRYELLAPQSHAFRVIYRTSATTPGQTRFFNIIRPGSEASDIAVFLEATGEPLPHTVVPGVDARLAGYPEAREDASYIQVELLSPVPEVGETRLRIVKTYVDAATYYENEDSLLVFDRRLTIGRNEIALPPGYRVESLSYPSQLRTEADGRLVLSFFRDHPGAADFRVEAVPLPGSLWSLPGWAEGETTVDPAMRLEMPETFSFAPSPTLDSRAMFYSLRAPETGTFDLVRFGAATPEEVPAIPLVEQGLEDAANYGLNRGLLHWFRVLDSPRGTVRLPRNYTVIDVTAPATIGSIRITGDGWQTVDFRNARGGRMPVLIRGREIDRPEAFRMGEVPIPPIEVVSGAQITRRDNMLKAMEEYRANPGNEPLLINYARTMAWYGRTRDAIDLYGEGLLAHPTSYRLLRHRGHRYLSNRLFDRAVEDLGRSADLLEGQWASLPQPDEADGYDASPRAYLRAIWYHLGVALYMARDLAEAERALKRSMEVAADDDQRCASAYWLVNTLIRLDRAEEIPAVLSFVGADMEIDANLSYSELVMLHAGLRTLEETLDINDATHPRFATLGYGVSNWLRLQGRENPLEQGARVLLTTLLQRILTTDAVMNFGFIAAEVDLHEGGL